MRVQNYLVGKRLIETGGKSVQAEIKVEVEAENRHGPGHRLLEFQRSRPCRENAARPVGLSQQDVYHSRPLKLSFTH